MWDLYRETDGGSIQGEPNQGCIQGDVRLTQEEQVWDVYRGRCAFTTGGSGKPSIQEERCAMYTEGEVNHLYREKR
jgi:hypothetical protein